MLSICLPIVSILLLYYLNLGSLVRRLILLEFISFYVLFSFMYMSIHLVLGTFFILFLFLIFVIEGVLGIVLIVLFTNYSGSSHVRVLVA